MYGGALPIARNRKSLKRKMTEAEYLDGTPEFDAKVAKTSAPESHPPASDVIIPQQEAQEADDSEHEDPENVIEISSGSSSSHISSESSDLSKGTLNFILLEQRVFHNIRLLSFDDNKVLKIINWIC